MVAPVRKRDRACPAQAEQTASAFKHFRPINRNWQASTVALMQHPREKLRHKNVQKQNSSKCARNVQQQTTGDPTAEFVDRHEAGIVDPIAESASKSGKD
jgi:hypothetical protein